MAGKSKWGGEQPKGRALLWHLPDGHEIDGVVYSGLLFPPDAINKVTSFNFREYDVVIAAYPKAGTSWLQEVLYLLHNKGDLATSNTLTLHEKVPFLEAKLPDETRTMDILEQMPSPRIIKSHLYPHFFTKPLNEKKAKFVVIIRDVKDTLVSYYNFYTNFVGLSEFKGDFKEFFELFKMNKLNNGSWYDFNLGWWALKDHPNVFVITYESMQRDLSGSIKRLDTFLETGNSEETLDKIIENTTFDAMLRNNPTNKSHLHTGKSGVFRKYFTDELMEEIDELNKEKLKGVDFWMH